MRIYEIPESFESLLESLENEEISEDEFTQAVDALEIDFIKNLEHICKIIKTAESQADAAKAERERLTAYERTRRAKTARLKEYIKAAMQSLELHKVSAGLFEVGIQRNSSPSVVVKDADLLPRKYIIPQPPKTDNKGLIVDWKSGIIQEDGNIQFRFGNHLKIR